MVYKTLSEIKQVNRYNGGHWFDAGNSAFFNETIDPSQEILHGKYFITKCDGFTKIKDTFYTVRKVDDEGSITTIKGMEDNIKTYEEAKAFVDWYENN